MLSLIQPLQPRVTKRLVAIRDVALNMLDSAMLGLFKRDHTGAGQVIEKAKQFNEIERMMVSSVDQKDLESYYAIHVIMDSLRRIVEYATDIAEVVLNLTIERIVVKEDERESYSRFTPSRRETTSSLGWRGIP